jgi:hypothetical protein
VLAKDLDDHFGLGWDDIAKAPDRLACRVELAADGVTVDPLTGVAAITNHAFLAPACLPANLLEEEGVHRALETDMEFIDGAFRDRIWPRRGTAGPRRWRRCRSETVTAGPALRRSPR